MYRGARAGLPVIPAKRDGSSTPSTMVAGLTPEADRSQDGSGLIAQLSEGLARPWLMPIDYEEITMGTDSSTNYQILPGDRLVVPGAPQQPEPTMSPSDRAQASPLAGEPRLPPTDIRRYFRRRCRSRNSAENQLTSFGVVERSLSGGREKARQDPHARNNGPPPEEDRGVEKSVR